MAHLCGAMQRLLALLMLMQLASANTVPPFFLYEGPEFDWLKNCTEAHPQQMKDYRLSQYSATLHFLHAALDHPARVYDIADPSIVVYVIPALVGFAIREKGCLGRSVEEMLEITGAALLASPAYQKRQGTDHFMSAFDWMGQQFLGDQWEHLGSFLPVAKNIALGLPESGWGPWLRDRGSCRVVMPYVAHFNRHKAEPVYDFFFMGGAQEQRDGYASRIRGGQLIGQAGYKSLFIVSDWPGPERSFPDICDYAACEADRRCGPCRGTFDSKVYRNFLSKSRFSLIFRGDTPTTSHLYDAVGSGVVPVLVSDDLWWSGLPFPGTVSWPDLVMSLPEDFDLGALNELNATAERLYQTKQAALERHKLDLLWNVHGSRVFGNTLYHVATYCISAFQAGSTDRDVNTISI